MAPAAVSTLPLDQIIQGDCISAMERLPAQSVDLIFADPPYNLQLSGELTRPTQTVVDAVDEDWDRFDSFADYDAFTRDWLKACQRLLRPTGTLWVIGTYHNIFRVGTQLLDLGFWILNDVVWHKTNPMPNFRGTRFQNATETLIWAKATRDKSRYTFNYHAMKQLNDGLQMQNVWHLPHVMGEEKLKAGGRRVHPTQKPEALLYRVISAASNPGDVVLDPFFGTGTTGAVAKRLSRRFIGIEIDADYAALARERIDAVRPIQVGRELLVTPSRRAQPKVAFGLLVENGRIEPGTVLTSRNGRHQAVVRADGQLEIAGHRGSIHRMGALVQELPGCNGWDFWHIAGADGVLLPLDALRQEYLAASAAQLGPAPANGAAESLRRGQMLPPL